LKIFEELPEETAVILSDGVQGRKGENEHQVAGRHTDLQLLKRAVLAPPAMFDDSGIAIGYSCGFV
jgi:hypothetical protein